MIVDVLSRSRVYLDEMYEVLASAVEAARPKASQARFIYMYTYILHTYTHIYLGCAPKGLPGAFWMYMYIHVIYVYVCVCMQYVYILNMYTRLPLRRRA